MALTLLHALREMRDPDLPMAGERSRAPARRVVSELAMIGAFYLAYSAARNRFGSAYVSPAVAFENAHSVIGIERSVGLFFESELQAFFLRWQPFVWSLNVFYGTFHFLVTGATLIWLFMKLPDQYRRWRNALAATTALAIIGFSLFPVMPPRLLADCGPYGACAGPALVDTIAEIGGLWTFDSRAMESVSNQYAAVPSLHVAWSLWCAAVVVSRWPHRWGRVVAISYTLATLLTVLVTANHYWLDAVFGALALAGGAAVAGLIERCSVTTSMAGAGIDLDRAPEVPTTGSAQRAPEITSDLPGP
ncbi:MAG: phosphatase PAP2 family protein [bacterium]|nr:phosphatase PAP2 family protein [bacterium]MCP5033435.1 phosphatase PAP2 family protein [Actinomycetes bacterium]